MEKQDVERMQTARKIKQQNAAIKNTEEYPATFNTPIMNDSGDDRQQLRKNNFELSQKENTELFDFGLQPALHQDTTIKARTEQFATQEEHFFENHARPPRMELQNSYHEQDLQHMRLFTQKYIQQKEMERLEIKSQLDFSVSQPFTPSEMPFSEDMELVTPDISKRDSFSIQESSRQNIEDDFTSMQESNDIFWNNSLPKEKPFSEEANSAQTYKSEKQMISQEQGMQDLRLFARRYAAEQKALVHPESILAEGISTVDENSVVQQYQQYQQEQYSEEERAEQQRQELLRQNEAYQQMSYRHAEEDFSQESDRPSEYPGGSFQEKQSYTSSARKYAGVVFGSTFLVGAKANDLKNKKEPPGDLQDASAIENDDRLERPKKAEQLKRYQSVKKKANASRRGVREDDTNSSETISASGTLRSKQNIVTHYESEPLEETSDSIQKEKDVSINFKKSKRRIAQAVFFERGNIDKYRIKNGSTTPHQNSLKLNSEMSASADKLENAENMQSMQRLRKFLKSETKHVKEISGTSNITHETSSQSKDIFQLHETDISRKNKKSMSNATLEKDEFVDQKKHSVNKSSNENPVIFNRRKRYEDDFDINEENTAEKKASKKQGSKKTQVKKKKSFKDSDGKKKESLEIYSEKQTNTRTRKAAERHGKTVAAIKWLRRGRWTKHTITAFQTADGQEEQKKRISMQQKMLLKGGVKTSFQLSKALIQLLMGFLPLVFWGAIFLLIFFAITNRSQSASSEYDGACYLAAKYESGGNPDQTGGDAGNACGEFQFDNRYELGPFVRWCYEKDSLTYAAFEPYLGMTTELKNNTGFYGAWHSICASNKVTFEAAQCEYVYTQTLQPLLTSLTQYYGFDFNNASDALKGCVLSFGNRDGKYVVSLKRYFDGTTASSTDREIIERAYNAMIARRPTISRWSYEKVDCLAQLDGALDIYAPSENGAGGIDWSWKKSNQTSASGNAAVQAALNAVGSGYSQTRRDDPGWYDCSSLVYRSYAAAGITYLNGKCAADQAQYLVNHNMTVSYSELQPGDLIFYSYEANGRYRNISHVAIYVGDGVMVHAANESRGVIKQALSQSNLSPQLYCRPQ